MAITSRAQAAPTITVQRMTRNRDFNFSARHNGADLVDVADPRLSRHPPEPWVALAEQEVARELDPMTATGRPRFIPLPGALVFSERQLASRPFKEEVDFPGNPPIEIEEDHSAAHQG
jgi:hypothetical protein